MAQVVFRRVFSAAFLVTLLFMIGCSHRSDSNGPASRAPQSQSTSVAEPQQSQPTPNPEIEKQQQQVAEALADAEAALKAIYSHKRKGQAVATAVLRRYLKDDDYEGAQSALEHQGAAVIREQNRWKGELAKRRSDLRKLESSQYSEVQEAARAASQKIDGEAKRFEKGLPPTP